MTTTTFPLESLTTATNNHPTAYVPLPTLFPSTPSCSTQLYISLNLNLQSSLPTYTTVLAFDPYLVAVISPDSASAFQAPEFTAS
ncbi:hypothetical protein BDZ45DRAFT_677703 [Acephala macrosclerotiorum]|nr:hypothetical protein BDZ45DRAFT_677703 [Acephala macrosclerotiorum]